MITIENKQGRSTWEKPTCHSPTRYISGLSFLYKRGKTMSIITTRPSYFPKPNNRNHYAFRNESLKTHIFQHDNNPMNKAYIKWLVFQKHNPKHYNLKSIDGIFLLHEDYVQYMNDNNLMPLTKNEVEELFIFARQIKLPNKNTSSRKATRRRSHERHSLDKFRSLLKNLKSGMNLKYQQLRFLHYYRNDQINLSNEDRVMIDKAFSLSHSLNRNNLLVSINDINKSCPNLKEQASSLGRVESHDEGKTVGETPTISATSSGLGRILG